MSDGRIFGHQTYTALKAAVRMAGRQAGGQEAVTLFTRVGHHSTVGRYTRPQDREHMPVDVAIDVDHEAGSPHILRAMADALGYVVVPRAAVAAPADRRWLRHICRLGQESGEALARLSEAVADDGVIDAEEIRRLGLRKELRDLAEALAAADAALRDVEDEDAEARS